MTFAESAEIYAVAELVDSLSNTTQKTATLLTSVIVGEATSQKAKDQICRTVAIGNWMTEKGGNNMELFDLNMTIAMILYIALAIAFL
jgi:hypothetical protein